MTHPLSFEMLKYLLGPRPVSQNETQRDSRTPDLKDHQTKKMTQTNEMMHSDRSIIVKYGDKYFWDSLSLSVCVFVCDT
jgi:hypothetical protein